MIYILGLNHRLQIKPKLKETKELLTFIADKIDALKIDLIAEEFSEEALQRHGIKSTTVQRFCRRNKMSHIFIDPGPEERTRLGIISRGTVLKESYNRQEYFKPKDYSRFVEEVKETFKPREKYWFEKIKPNLKKDILVICGWDHMISFSKLLEERSIHCLVIEQVFS
jgi:hypothetical protein